MRIIKFNQNIHDENAYLIVDGIDTTLIDPGLNKDKIIKYLNDNNLRLNRIFLTHGHYDHIGDLEAIYNEFKPVDIYLSNKEIDFLYDISLNLSDKNNPIILSKEIKVNTVNDQDIINGFQFFDSPGHTKGSVIIKKDKYLFTGDTLFKDAVGRIDLPTGNIKAMRDTLRSIPIKFSMNSIILPGHFLETSLEEEYKTNHYLSDKRRG